ncbi:receptor-like protein kinase FERONIA [Quercus suber]|uniref:receptor-like protein kinase FERONIA n=1 Tax=Quercus suber TaxID=58331 RepID=UPI000CE17C60|nr:receptor-like protein kinase FERONIA [Quercus suber]POE46390.1 receptor-like protein kinase feronia [Quercus suber]
MGKGNRSNAYLWATLRPCFTPLYIAFLLHHVTSTVGSNSPSPYIPEDNILLDCGSYGNSTALDGRPWIGDKNSIFFPVEHPQNNASLTISAVQQSSSATQLPYTTARLSLSPFSYIFSSVTAGQKFVRLYFYPATYGTFDRSKARFSVKAGPFTLLHNFNASLTADADDDSGDTIFREFCVNIEEGQRLNLTLTPSDSNSFAFVNGIEILSMPTNLYYTPSDDQGLPFIGQEQWYRVLNGTVLEMLYRINVGGRSISPTEDTGMFRSWNSDRKYFTEDLSSVVPVNPSIELNFSKIPPYTAPEGVYMVARTMGINQTLNKSYNLTWQLPVDSQFDYLVRLHFCEFEPEVKAQGDRQFLIFIANQSAERAADVIKWSGGSGVPVYRDYVVSLFGIESQKRVYLSIAIAADPLNWETVYRDAILNGIEIFKLNDTNGNLAGPNPNTLPLPTKSNNNRIKIMAIVGGGISGIIVLLILGFLILRRAKTTWRWRGPFSFHTSKSTKTRESTLPYLCRYFSLAEIKAATKNFDQNSIIGVGGFGDVYKGSIHTDGGATHVAIKRLKPGSQQGVQEFKTEIEILSQLRHHHLVSLIGYCNDGNEMILVYDFMPGGTLCSHLYNTDKTPLTWDQRLQICIGAARALNYLHIGAKHPIIHRDVKSTNILLDEKWTAKVSDFGLSKFGPTSTSKAHVSTTVKGSFGYLDPEYYRRQQLTEKSDVYSFGVVLFEVLCARPPIMHTVEHEEMSLAEWAPKCYRNGKLDQIVDPLLKAEIEPECLKKFGEIAVNCLHDNGTERPSMNDVVWGLELTLQLQGSVEKAILHGEQSFASKEYQDGLMSIFSEIINPDGR